MKRKVMIWIAVLGLLGIAGCSKTGQTMIESENVPVQTEQDIMKSPESETPDITKAPESEAPDTSDLTPDTFVEEQAVSASSENNDTEGNDKPEMDFTYDYSEDIKAEVAYVVSGSPSLQNELEDIEKVILKYTSLAEEAQTQGEMNVSSQWFFEIWDTELNNLWSRFSNSADQQTKEKILAEQRNWADMKEEVILRNIGSSDENGSMYPLLVNSFLEEITRNRAYFLANELAKIKGESFVMPEKSTKYGLFVDNQGTGSVYSSLITRRGQEEDDEALISIFRLGKMEGTFVDNGNGELAFTSNDESVKGIIKINGWEGAGFTVTETSEESVFSVGEEFHFPFAF